MVTPMKPVDWPLAPHVPQGLPTKNNNKTTATEKGRQFVDNELSQYHSVNRLCSETPSRRRRQNCPRGFSLTLASVLYQSVFWVNSCLGLALLVWLEKGTEILAWLEKGPNFSSGWKQMTEFLVRLKKGTEFLVWLEKGTESLFVKRKRKKKKGLNF